MQTRKFAQVLTHCVGHVLSRIHTKCYLHSTELALHSILFDYGSAHICENSNKLGRVTSQSKVENKMAPSRTAATIFTTILDLDARRRGKEASKARRRKIHRLKQQQRMRQFLFKQALTFVLAIPWLILSHTSFLFCVVFNSCCTASSLHKTIKSLVSSSYHVSAILFDHAL